MSTGAVRGVIVRRVDPSPAGMEWYLASCLALPLPFELRCGTRIRGARGRRIGQAEWDQLIGPWGRQLWEAVVRSVEGSSRVGPWPPYA